MKRKTDGRAKAAEESAMDKAAWFIDPQFFVKQGSVGGRKSQALRFHGMSKAEKSKIMKKLIRKRWAKARKKRQ